MTQETTIAPTAPSAEDISTLPLEHIGVDLIVRSPFNPRAAVTFDEVAELADSIKADGLLQPILLRRKSIGFELVAGERRWTAFRKLKRDTIPARVIGSTTDFDAAVKTAAENLDRENLNPIEEARQYQILQDGGMTQAQIAARFGGSQPKVANTLRLLRLPPSVQLLLTEGKLSGAHGVALARFAAWPAVCAFIAQCAVKDGDKAKDLEGRVPHGWALCQAKLAVQLDYNEKPPQSMDAADFYSDSQRYGGGTWWCFAPAKWKQWCEQRDAESKKREAKLAAKAGDDTDPAAAAWARAKQRKMAENKARRARLKAALDAFAKRTTNTHREFALVAERALRNVGGKRIEEIAEKIGIDLPAKVKRALGDFYGCDAEGLISIPEVDLRRLTVQVLVEKDVADELRGGLVVPESIEFLGVTEKDIDEVVKAQEYQAKIARADDARIAAAPASLKKSGPAVQALRDRMKERAAKAGKPQAKKGGKAK